MAKCSTYLFTDNFSAYGDHEHPDGWVVERHTDRVHQHGWVEAKAYNILCRGNKHIPLTPPLKDFTLSFQGRGDDGAANAGCYIFFRYDSDLRAGYYIKRQWGTSGGKTYYGVCGLDADQLLETKSDPAPRKNRAVNEWNEIRLEVQGNTFTVFHNNDQVGRFDDAENRYPDAGCVAFDRDRPTEYGARGPFFLKRVCIRAAQVPPPATLWKPFRVEFPADHNGIVSPFYYQLETAAYANHVQITARLTGGPAERHDPVLLRYRDANAGRWQNERLINPYLRLERPGGGSIGTYYLFRGAVGLKEHWDRRAPGLPPADIECPVERVIRLPALPADPNVFIGYDFYEAEERNWMKGGPTEAWVDPRRGVVISSGVPLKESTLCLEIRSPPDKAISALISKDEPRRAKALEFARSNHYFMEKERVRFSIRIRHRWPDFKRDNVRTEWVLEDVFRQPLKAGQRCQLRLSHDTEASRRQSRLGAQTLVSGWVSPGSLPVGVYHIVARVRRGTELLAETRRAFEIISPDPSKPSPPQASGLPELLFYESSDFVSSADVFDPWTGRGVDEGHYVSHNGFRASFAEAHRTWSVVHLYRRKWWLVLADPLRKNPEDLPELVRQADLVNASGLFKRFDLWLRHTYRQPSSPQKGPGVFDVLLEFLQSPAGIQSGDAKLKADDIRLAGELSEDQFMILVEHYWKPWLEFFNRWYAQTYRPQAYARSRALNPICEWGCGGTYPPYGSVYKSAWFPNYMGRNLRSGWTRSINGPMRLESYPWVCGYPIQRDVFQLAAMKLEAPELRLYPEVYSLTGIPADFHVMLGSPPYARAAPPAASFRKRFFEYSYAAVWFGAKGFDFWNDNGFQPKHWGREQFSEFLSAWSVIRRARPKKPLRTTAFVYSQAACRQHPDTLERYVPRYYQDGKGPVFFGDIYNTAEECVAFAYEQSRADGQLAGFIVDLEQIRRLSARDVHTLVLPPLLGLTDTDREMIRKKHAAGINLLAFESVPGLEDLFGVAPLKEPVVLGGIRMHAAAARKKPWLELKDDRETILHALCRSAYRCQGSRIVLDGLDHQGRFAAPALVKHLTRWGRTALFTIPPTVVRRESGDAVFSYGKASISRLINQATAYILRELGSPQAETTAGKLIGFWDTTDQARLIVEEDNHPRPARAIEPIVTICLPRLTAKRIRCDRPFEVISVKPACIRLRLSLRPNECAMITVGGKAKK